MAKFWRPQIFLFLISSGKEKKRKLKYVYNVINSIIRYLETSIIRLIICHLLYAAFEMTSCKFFKGQLCFSPIKKSVRKALYHRFCLCFVLCGELQPQPKGDNAFTASSNPRRDKAAEL